MKLELLINNFTTMENTEGQIEATPASPEATPTEDAQSQIQPEQAEADKQTQDELPEGVKSEHAKDRFRELSQQAKEGVEAKQALEDLKKRKSVFDEFMPQQEVPNFQPQYEPPKMSQYVDETNTVDIAKFDEAQERYHQTMQMGTRQAIQTAQQTERRIQERDAYSKYPELNPVADNHDDDFKQLVADRLARNWASGVNKSLVEVADDVSRVYAKRSTEEAVAKKAVEQYKEAQVNREQGPMEKGNGAGRQEVTNERLKEVSRKGTPEQQEAALAERLRRMKM